MFNIDLTVLTEWVRAYSADGLASLADFVHYEGKQGAYSSRLNKRD